MHYSRNLIDFFKKQILQGNKKFAIYPYGANGRKISSCLQELFNIEPVSIIDNELYKYNDKIENIDSFKLNYTDDTIVILTIEDIKLNELMYKQLSEFIATDKIININDLIFNAQKLKISYLFTETKKQNYLKDNKKAKAIIKVRILHDWESLWNTCETFANACMEDNEIDFKLIINSDWMVTYKHIEYLKNRYNYVMLEDYDAKEDKPDIFVIIDTNNFHLPIYSEIANNANKTVLLSSSLIPYLGLNIGKTLGENYIDYCNYLKSALKIVCDYYLFDSYIYNQIKEPFNNIFTESKLIEIGNPKYDGIYNKLKTQKNFYDWEKLKNKKIILWTTGHCVFRQNDGSLLVNRFLAFDVYTKYIFDYAYNNPDIGIIFRPNPPIIRELKTAGIWSERDEKELKEYIDKTDNIVFDDLPNYDRAYSLADAILSESGCGILLSALPTLKPIGVLYRSKINFEYDPKLTENYYRIHNQNELIDFFEMIKRGEDSKYEIRKDVMKRFIKNFDGKNGYRVKELIKNL